MKKGGGQKIVMPDPHTPLNAIAVIDESAYHKRFGMSPSLVVSDIQIEGIY